MVLAFVALDQQQQTSSANCASRLANAARSPDQFDAAFESLARERAEGVLVLVDATFWTHRAPGGPDRRR